MNTIFRKVDIEHIIFMIVKYRMEIKMKNLRKLAGISIFLILIFMVIALFQSQKEREISVIPEQIEYYFDMDWFP